MKRVIGAVVGMMLVAGVVFAHAGSKLALGNEVVQASATPFALQQQADEKFAMGIPFCGSCGTKQSCHKEIDDSSPQCRVAGNCKTKNVCETVCDYDSCPKSTPTPKSTR